MWQLSLVLAKFGMYVGLSSLIGGVFCLWFLRNQAALIKPIRWYAVRGATIGAVFALLGFFLQIGAIADSGMQGLMDWGLIVFLWDTPVGDTLEARLIGFVVAAVALTIGVANSPGANRFTRPALAAALVSILFSFQMTGHTAGEHLGMRVAVVLHLAAVGIWIGSLVPLFWLCRGCQPQQLAERLKGFGLLAQSIVGGLVVAGAYLLVSLPQPVGAIFSSTWGGTLILKLALVALLLALAAHNRFSLVPAIEQGEEPAAFKLTVVFEIIFAAIILLVTAAATTVMGPPI